MSNVNLALTFIKCPFFKKPQKATEIRNQYILLTHRYRSLCTTTYNKPSEIQNSVNLYRCLKSFFTLVSYSILDLEKTSILLTIYFFNHRFFFLFLGSVFLFLTLLFLCSHTFKPFFLSFSDTLHADVIGA